MYLNKIPAKKFFIANNFPCIDTIKANATSEQIQCRNSAYNEIILNKENTFSKISSHI